LEQALANYQKAIALNQSYAQAHYNLGLLYEDLQQFDKANAEYQLGASHFRKSPTP
jgi:tetratricopeptide (TPR) repeat protein